MQTIKSKDFRKGGPQRSYPRPRGGAANKKAQPLEPTRSIEINVTILEGEHLTCGFNSKYSGIGERSAKALGSDVRERR